MKSDEELERLVKLIGEEGQKSDMLVGILFLAIAIFGAASFISYLTVLMFFK